MFKRGFSGRSSSSFDSFHAAVAGVWGGSLRLDRWLTLFPGALISCDEIVSRASKYCRSGTGEGSSGCKNDGNKPEVAILRGHHDRHLPANVQTRLLMPAADVSPDSECLFSDNARLLINGADLLGGLSVEDFVMQDERCLGGSIGGHARHCVEFYQGFLGGLADGYLDYDARARNLLIESDPATASEALRELANALKALAAGADTGRVLQIVENQDVLEPAWSASSVGRELRFLLSHTIHHYALIAILLRLRGIRIPETFGVAPSTLRHRERQTMNAACAR